MLHYFSKLMELVRIWHYDEESLTIEKMLSQVLFLGARPMLIVSKSTRIHILVEVI